MEVSIPSPTPFLLPSSPDLAAPPPFFSSRFPIWLPPLPRLFSSRLPIWPLPWRTTTSTRAPAVICAGLRWPAAATLAPATARRHVDGPAEPDGPTPARWANRAIVPARHEKTALGSCLGCKVGTTPDTAWHEKPIRPHSVGPFRARAGLGPGGPFGIL
jgi:hypothetical protein